MNKEQKQLMEKYKRFIEKEFERKGYKNTAGVYALMVNDQIVYIGKSRNIINRLASHRYYLEFSSEHKYQFLREARRYGLKIDFKILYRSKKHYTQIDDDIGEAEGAWIRYVKPVLNYQIPKEENYHKYSVNKDSQTVTVKDVFPDLMLF